MPKAYHNWVVPETCIDGREETQSRREDAHEVAELHEEFVKLRKREIMDQKGHIELFEHTREFILGDCDRLVGSIDKET